ncbi:GD25731 [Drosophila simulans]|uniref:GD25731 n=2 Tax=melanogaster subgroup TaxID=32351 RepID=B4QEV7_DROSI|nr:GD25731 [Drosophila simulans]
MRPLSLSPSALSVPFCATRNGNNTASPRNYVRSRSTPQSPHSPQAALLGGVGGGRSHGSSHHHHHPYHHHSPSPSPSAPSPSCPTLQLQPRLHQSEQQLCQRRRIYASTGSAANIMMDRESLSEWAKDKPLSILQLDPADRAVLRIAAILHRRRSIIMR